MKITDDRIRAMLLGRRAFRVIQFPGAPEIKVAVRLLSESEIDACRVAGQSMFLASCEKRKWSPEKAIQIDPLMHTRYVDRQIVWRAFFDPDTISAKTPEPFFPSETDVAELDSVMTSDLLAAYVEHQDLVTPGRTLGAEEVDALIDAMGKGPPEVVFRSFARSTLESFTLTMAKRLSTSQTGRSSTT